MVSPQPKTIYCTLQRGLQSVALGDPGAFFIDRIRMLFHIRTPGGTAALDINPLNDTHYLWNGKSTLPSLSHAITKGGWRGYLKDGQLIEVPL